MGADISNSIANIIMDTKEDNLKRIGHIDLAGRGEARA
jgi:hypothetical protein